MAAGIRTVAVVAATGNTGKHAVDLLKDKPGTRCVAIGRNPEKLEAMFKKYPNVEIRVAEMHDVEGMKKALDGVDVVLTTSGITFEWDSLSSSLREMALTDIYTTTARNVTQIMKEKKIKRLIFMGSVVNIQPEDKPWVGLSRMIYALSWIPILSSAVTNQVEALKYLQESSDEIDWTYVRPGALEDGPGGKELVHGAVGVDVIEETPIDRRDVARFMIEQIDSPEYVHKCPALCTKPERN